MPFFVKQATMDQIQAEIDRLTVALDSSETALAARSKELATASAANKAAAKAIADAENDNAALAKESERLTRLVRSGADELTAEKEKSSKAEKATEAASAKGDEARVSLGYAKTEIASLKSDVERERGLRASESSVAKDEVRGLKATHADVLKTERTQVFNLNELVAKLNKDVEALKSEHAKALAAAAKAKDDIELDMLQKLADEQARRLADVTAARSASDAEVVAARDLIDKVRATRKGV